LRKDYSDDADIKVSLTDYVRERFVRQLAQIDINDAREMITLMLSEAYYHYSVGQDDDAFGREKMAREIYDYYGKKYQSERSVDRVVLPGFDILRYVGLNSFLSDERYPDYVRGNLLNRIKIERPELFEKLSKQHEFVIQEMKKQQEKQGEQ